MALDLKIGLGGKKLPSIPWAKLTKLTRVHKILIAAGVLALLWGGFIYLMYMPQSEKISRLQNDIRNAKIQLDRLRQVERNLRKFKKEYQETEIKFKKALQLLPDKEEIPTLLANISSLGAEAGLDFLLFQPQQEIPRNFYAEIPLRLEVAGPYHNVATFFDKVSRLSRIVNVSNMQMTRLKETATEVILKTACVATTYKFIETPPEEQKGKRRPRKK